MTYGNLVVNTLDSKSSSSECGFDSHLEYNLNVKFNQNPVNINIYRVFHFIKPHLISFNTIQKVSHSVAPINHYLVPPN